MAGQFKLNTNYAISKYYGEMEVWRGIAEGLNAVIVNPSTVLGYGDWNHQAMHFLKMHIMDFPWYTNGVNGFVDVEDVSRAIVRLLATNISSERFILNGENWAIANCWIRLQTVLGKEGHTGKQLRCSQGLRGGSKKSKFIVYRQKSVAYTRNFKNCPVEYPLRQYKIINALPDFTFTPLEQTIKKACGQYVK